MTVSPAAVAHAEDLADFVAASPSSYHAAAEVARRLIASGFTALNEGDAWPAQAGGRFLIVRDGGVIAWIAGLTVALIGVGYVYYGLDRLLTRARPRPLPART